MTPAFVELLAETTSATSCLVAAVEAGGHAECLHSDEFNVSYQLVFTRDPQVQANVPNFKPNFIPFPVGTDLRAFALPFPAKDPASNGVPPSLRIGAH